MKIYYLLRKLNSRLASRYNSRTVFLVLVGIFCAQAAWIAFTGNYPMAFDEDYHLGLIRIYAHHLNPFLTHQPIGGDAFGAVARDPSYLYEYLMSFPYRLINLFTDDQTIQVICLRIVNIALFASALPLFRRLLLRLKTPVGLVTISFAIFVLLPVAPLLASQINYDNLLIPLVAMVLLLTISWNDELSKKNIFNVTKLAVLVMLCLATSLVMYSFLPIFLAIMLFCLGRIILFHRSQKELASVMRHGLSQLSRRRSLLLAAGLVFSLFIFGQRYAVNIIKYHDIIPDCSQVLSVKQCSSYGPWIRDYNFKINKVATPPHSLWTFEEDWFYGMWLRIFFAVDGPGTDFETRGPLFLPGVCAIIFSCLGGLLLLLYGRRIWRRYDHSYLVLSAMTIGIYVTTLWVDEYKSFLRTGQPVAINGRYLLPIALPAIILLLLGYRELLQYRPKIRQASVYVLLICFLAGGGVTTYILRSNDTWYWPSPVVKTANHVVRKVIAPFTPGSSRPTAFLKFNQK